MRRSGSGRRGPALGHAPRCVHPVTAFAWRVLRISRIRYMRHIRGIPPLNPSHCRSRVYTRKSSRLTLRLNRALPDRTKLPIRGFRPSPKIERIRNMRNMADFRHFRRSISVTFAFSVTHHSPRRRSPLARSRTARSVARRSLWQLLVSFKSQPLASHLGEGIWSAPAGHEHQHNKYATSGELVNRNR